MSFAPFLAPERDGSLSVGRAKDNSAVTAYTIPGLSITTTGSFTDAVNTDYYGRVWLEKAAICDQLAFEVTTLTGGANIRVGLYRADQDWQPLGAPLADSGDISAGSTGVKTYTPSPAIYLARGRYLTALNTSAGGPQVRAFRGAFRAAMLDTTLGTSPSWSRLSVSRSYAAFPTPGTKWDNPGPLQATEDNFVVLRLSAA